MHPRSPAILVVSVATFALALGACAPGSSVTIGNGGRPAPQIETTRRGGPPPHAPAHGHRRKHHRSQGHDVELVFDSGLGVYVVVDAPGLYFWDGYYLRIDGDQWYASIDLDRGWTPRERAAVPPGLQKHGHKTRKAHKGKRKVGPASRR